MYFELYSTCQRRRIINCGLQHVPDMTYLSTHVILHMVYVVQCNCVTVESNLVCHWELTLYVYIAAGGGLDLIITYWCL